MESLVDRTAWVGRIAGITRFKGREDLSSCTVSRAITTRELWPLLLLGNIQSHSHTPDCGNMVRTSLAGLSRRPTIKIIHRHAVVHAWMVR